MAHELREILCSKITLVNGLPGPLPHIALRHFAGSAYAKWYLQRITIVDCSTWLSRTPVLHGVENWIVT